MIFILLLGVWAFLVLGCLAAWLFDREAAWRRMGGRSLFALLLLASLYTGSIIWQNRPSAVWQDIFGYTPPNGISAIETYEADYMDWKKTYLAFHATPAAMNSILHHGWQRSTPLEPGGTDKDAPNWWTPHTTKTTQTYRLKVKRKRFLMWEEEFFIYDPSTQVAYYFGSD